MAYGDGDGDGVDVMRAWVCIMRIVNITDIAMGEMQSCFDYENWTWHSNCNSSNIYEDNIYVITYI